MADNATLNAGSGGITLATDDIGGVHYQETKLIDGTKDSSTPVAVANGVNGNALRVTMANDSDGVPDLNTVNASNSSSSALGISAAFTGTGVDCSGYSNVTIVVFADQASATDGLQLQFSTDNTNWDDSNDFSLAASETRRFQIGVVAQYFRVVYTNGTTGQSAFRLQTILHANPPILSTHRLQDSVDPDRSAQLIKAAIVAQAAGSGNFVPVQTTGGGNLKVALEEIDGALLDGGVEAGALLVTIANDSTGLLSVDDNGGSLTIDNTTLDNAGGGTEAAALRVTLANDSTGLLSVDDNGGSLTVDNADMATIAGAVSGTEMQVDVVAPLPAGTNAIGKLVANSGVDIGDVDVTSIAAGSNVVGDVGISGARTSGGTTLYKNIDVDESEDQVKATAGQVFWIHAMNLANAVRYLKIYNATAANVTVGTTVPDLTFPIPTQGDTNGAGFVLVIPNGIAFGTAITIAATTGVADANSGAPGANEVIVNLGYA